MVSKIDTEIFLPISFKVYKENKINLLKTHIKTVNTLERIKRLNELSKIKTQQKRLLRAIIKETKEHYSKLQNSLPTSLELEMPEPKSARQKYIQSKRTAIMPFQPTSRIDDELNKIQEKLKSLKI